MFIANALKEPMTATSDAFKDIDCLLYLRIPAFKSPIINGTLVPLDLNPLLGFTDTGTTVVPHLICNFAESVGSGLSNGLPFASFKVSRYCKPSSLVMILALDL